MTNLYKFNIRRAEIDDIPTIMEIMQEAFAKYCVLAKIEPAKITVTGETANDIANDIETKDVYVAVQDNIIIGSVRIEILSDNRARLSRFGVLGDYQGCGIGRTLLDTVDDSMRAKGIETLELYTAEMYKPLVEFYRRNGFKIEKVTNNRGYARAKLVKEYDNI